MKTLKAQQVELTPTEPTKAVQLRQHQEVGQALSASQVTERLRFIHQVMKENMTEGTDYGKVPGCGDKPGLFQPGAQKLSMTFQLNPEVRDEVITDYPGFHRGYRFVVRVSNGTKFAEGVGECSTLESKYRFRAADRTCPNCHKPAIIVGKEEYGGGFVCFKKKGGCGTKFPSNDPAIVSQPAGKVEHENPPDFWNTAQKMGFKRAFVHAIINATNTSELWSQDLEDLAANGVTREEPPRNSNTRGMTGGNHNSGAGGGESQQPAGKSASARVSNLPVEAKAGNANPPARTVPPTGKCATVAQRDKMIEELLRFDEQSKILEYAQKASILLPTETLLDWSLRFVPVTQSQMDLLKAAIRDFFDGDDPVRPFENPEPPTAKPEKPNGKPVTVPRDQGVGTWRQVEVPFGKDKGKPLGQLDNRQLRAYAQLALEDVSSPTFTGRDDKEHQKSPVAMAKAKEWLKHLEAAAVEMGFTVGGDE